MVAIVNSILWDDNAASGPEIYFEPPPTTPPTINVSYSNVEGSWSGEGNKNVNPNFISPAQGNYRLQCPSECIDAGSADAVALDDLDVDENPNTTGYAPDLDLLPRVVGGSPAKPDMGCYEKQLCVAIDINDDGCVNVQDMLAVINAWGICPSPICAADIAPVSGNACGTGAGDGTVNVQDLLAVINSWGGCPTCLTQTAPPEDVYDCMNYCTGAEDYGDCLAKCMCAVGYDTCD